MIRRFQVEVVSRQRALYHVDAPDAQTAERLAVQRWQSGEPSDLTGFESSRLDAVHASEAPDEIRQAQDDELLIRFISERERLLGRMGGDLLNSSISDAVSASQAAADLGWFRTGQNEGKIVDAVRAAESLERLCARKKLVCFERDRIRAGERGAIRLYCTPDHLERLSEGLFEPTPLSAGA